MKFSVGLGMALLIVEKAALAQAPEPLADTTPAATSAPSTSPEQQATAPAPANTPNVEQAVAPATNPPAAATITSAPPPPEPTEQQRSGPEAMGALFFGPGLFDMSPLNDRLRANGYQTVPSSMILVGGEGHAVFRSGFVFGARGAGLLSPTRNGPGDLQTRFGGGFGMLEFGYAFVHTEPVLLSLSAGVGGYGTSFEIDNGQSQSFDAVLHNPQQGASLGRSGLLVGATLAVDGRIPLGSSSRIRKSFIAIGLRVSGLSGPALGGWTLAQGSNATHGPALGLNGGFVALAIGFGGYPRRRD